MTPSLDDGSAGRQSASARLGVKRGDALDILLVGSRQRRVANEQHVLRVAHRVIGEIEAAGHHDVVGDDELVVHEVVGLIGLVPVIRNGILPDQPACHLFPGVELVRSHLRGLPLPLDLVHLRTVVETGQRYVAIDGLGQRREDRPRRKDHRRHVEPTPRRRDSPDDLLHDRRAIARREGHRHRHIAQLGAAAPVRTGRFDDPAARPKVVEVAGIV